MPSPSPAPRLLMNLLGDETKASSRVRGYWIADELRDLGWQVRIDHATSKSGLLKIAAGLPFQDVVLFQKVCTRYHPTLLAIAKRAGVKVAYDIDDFPPGDAQSNAVQVTQKMMRKSDLVMAGSGALLAYAAGFNEAAHLVRTGVKVDNYAAAPSQADAKPCIGWIGNGRTYRRDLIEVLGPPLAAVAREHPLRLRLIGSVGEADLYDYFETLQGVEVDFLDQIAWGDPAAVRAALAPVDIGVYPLLPGGLNDYKCGFKALEYMASAIPTIASTAPGNADLIMDGQDGLLVDSPAAWEAALRQLITDPARRQAIGETGRTRVMGELSTHALARQVDQLLRPA